MNELAINKAKSQINNYLNSEGVNFIHFVDISSLNKNQTRGFTTAILFGIALSPDYIVNVSNTPDFVQRLIQHKKIDEDEFHLTELKTDALADSLANDLKQSGIKAFSQSESNLEKTGFYKHESQTTPLPHKTIALRAGIGWIGKNNLLVHKQFGCAFSMCSVLTNIESDKQDFIPTENNCGSCIICIDACKPRALKGSTWNKSISRDEMLAIQKCTTCLQCMMRCPFSQKMV